MATVHTHEVAIHSADKESVTMVRIRRGMKVCPMSTKALLMAMTVRPCVTTGDKIFEESEAADWETEMQEHTWENKALMDMVYTARTEENDEATKEARVFVVACTPRLVTTAQQARTLGKDILDWLAQECVIYSLLPEGMVSPEKRTEENLRDILDHWLSHGDLSIVGKRVKAQSRSKTGQRERDERDNPWMVVPGRDGAADLPGAGGGADEGEDLRGRGRPDGPSGTGPAARRAAGMGGGIGPLVP